jgi:hypothetical protein
MNLPVVHPGVAPQTWLQHNMPWLGLFALVLGLFTYDGDDMGFDPDERNG